ncbi:aldehyde dehydrogenase family protein [Gordonia sp. zg691]|uniref:aldehyde dehydrogenase family protein n=1 Tax=Gordonia jinghuaiqii TaxID=2758710 RepID=UPI0016626ABD|nr:aldehyde dehydrogenase family protein [Gordonia jinghuaiqii]MBD0861701.1 aldehyde dehydrogenase family protein [Gordonia jinghuaiqii]
MSDTLYIDGRWCAAASGETREIRCPADNSVVGVVAEADAADTEAAIAAARRAFDDGRWSATPAAERGDLLLRVADQIDTRRDDFVRAETLDTGKRPYESDLDMTDIANCFRYFGKLAASDAGRVVDAGSPDADSRIVHEPVGVCGLITPWNYPLLQAAWKVAPALAAGNTFVLKPAELTPHTSILLMEVLDGLGLPAGVANLVLGAGARAGAPLSSHPDIDLVSFTGGLVTGRVIAREAAATVKKVALELGGKNPNVVFADACATDELLAAAVDNALNAAFLHSGQVCSAGARLIIEESAHDRFVDELVRRAEQIRLGLPYSEGTETGPLISEAHRDKVHAYVEQARAEGAIIRTGGAFATGDHGSGSLDDGWFYLPTVIDRADRSMACVQDEAFGPTVTVETFTTEDEAVTLANDTVYGLAGAVWSADAARARRIAARVRAGTVWVNDFGPYLPEAEWGGYGQSGFGRELGPSGLAEYRETKHVYENLRPGVTGWFADRDEQGRGHDQRGSNQ